MTAAAILNFKKCQYLRGGYKYLYHIRWEDILRPRPYRGDHVTKGRNRKLICVTSSDYKSASIIQSRRDSPHHTLLSWQNVCNGGGRHFTFS